MKNKKSRLEHIWPVSINDISKEDIENLDDEEFKNLIYALRNRSRSNNVYGDKYYRRLRSIIIVKKGRSGGFKIPSRLLAWRKKESTLLDNLCPERSKKWIPVLKRRQSIKISLKSFSFLDNAAQTLSVLQEMADAETYCVNAQIDFEDDKVLDIGPYLVWGMMRRDMAPYMSGGIMNPSVQKVLKSVGLKNYMQIRFKDDEDSRDIWSFPLQQKRDPGTTTNTDLIYSPPTYSKVSDELVNTVNEWIKKSKKNLSLSPEGRSQLNNLTTEILNNAERHSDANGDGNWYVAGFMALRSNDIEEMYICHLSFVSIGYTISDTILLSQDKNTIETLDHYIGRHTSKFLPNRLDKNDLATVVALQDGISRLRQADGHSTGGVGMMDVVEFVNELGLSNSSENQPIVSIISGHTGVRFSDRYARGVTDETGRRLQWFNTKNSLEQAPDGNYVSHLPYRFPGTIISMRFCLEIHAHTEQP